MKKTIILSFFSSFIIHVVYIVGSIVFGYVETKNYQPQFMSEEITFLQNEVAFGTIGSPSYLLVTFITLAFICGLIIKTIKRILF